MDDLEFLKQEWERYNRIREAANKFLEEHEQDKGTEAYNLICQTRKLAADRAIEIMGEIIRTMSVKTTHEWSGE